MKKILLKILFFILRSEARIILTIKKPEIIAITGSIAKTSTKEALYEVMGKKFKVARSGGNLNNEIGVPLAIFGYEQTPPKILYIWICSFGWLKGFFLARMLILEIGADKFGDIEYLTSFIKPHVAIITSVGPSHLQVFKTLDNVAKEKAKLIEGLTPDDWAVLNQSDPEVALMANKTKAKVIYFTTDLPQIAKNAAKKVAIEIYGMNEDDVEKILNHMKAPAGRMNIIRGPYTIIDDTYNANPLSMESALETLKQMGGKRKVAVLGDMLELGSFTEQGHKKIGEKASQIADELVFVGKFAKFYQDGIKNDLETHIFSDSDQANKDIKKIIKSGDLILIKGSRGAKMEKIVAALNV